MRVSKLERLQDRLLSQQITVALGKRSYSNGLTIAGNAGLRELRRCEWRERNRRGQLKDGRFRSQKEYGSVGIIVRERTRDWKSLGE